MENFEFPNFEMGQFAPGGLFETYVTPNDHPSKFGHGDHNIMDIEESSLFETILSEASGDEWMEDMELTSDSMASLLELQQITEVKSDPPQPRPSVIMRQEKKPSMAYDLTNIMIECGIEEVVEEDNLAFYPTEEQQVGSPATSSVGSELEQNQELIDELEDFFIKTEGTPTNVYEDDVSKIDLDLITTSTLPNTINSELPINPGQILKALSSGNVFDSSTDNKGILTEEDLNNAYTTSVVSNDGQNVIIIIAPSSPQNPPSPTFTKINVNSPSPATTSDYESSCDTDPEWSPSPNPANTIPSPHHQPINSTPGATKTIKKKYARSKPPQPPSGPYPKEKKERKKAQNRTAAFRYREKRKTEQDDVDTEIEQLSMKNIVLRDKLTEMETEFKYLKKLMTEAGLGKYAQAVRL